MAACLLALVLLAGCGSEESTPADQPADTAPPAGEPETQADETAGPPGEPPATEEGGPPPAWIETSSGSAWMAYGSYCWTNVCVDVLHFTCDDTSVPSLEVRPGDPIRFHLAFAPDEADLTLGAPSSRPEVVSVTPARVIEWQGEYDGHLLLFATSEEGDVSYQACVRIPA